jgi:peptidoglycan/LPS O-acetylase OafA/YrhL
MVSTLGVEQRLTAGNSTHHQALSPHPSSFRPDIEGLRAVAILLVVCFHAGMPWLRGSFIGVDVFFVLSGYLITELLLNEMDRTGGIDFARFYARRIRRLLPASLLMLVCTLLAAVALLSPIEVVRVSKSAIATATYVSNVWFFLRSTDYFSPNVNANPLLHTWSLAVEEQFYLVWPFLVFLCAKGNRPRKIIIGALTAVTILSLAASVWLTRALQPFAFFGTPTRGWEFAAGGLAMLLQKSEFLRIFRHVAAAWLGAALILAAAVWLTPTSGFPGALAVIPVAGTVMVLIAGKFAASQTGLFALLGSRVFQTLGGLSYSWYLWHWPVLVFGRILLPARQGMLTSILLLLASLLIAWGTHSLIENPIRFSRSLVVKPTYSLLFGVAMTIVGAVSGAIFLTLGQRSATSPKQLVFLNASDDVKYERDCITGFRNDQLKICSFGSSSSSTLVLFGDSHAGQWLPALREVANREPWHVLTVLKQACPSAMVPIYNPRLQREEHECATWRNKALSYIHSLKPSIVVTSNASGYVKHSSLQDGYAQLSIQKWQDGIGSTLQSLNASAGLVVLLRDTPRADFDVPICLSRTTSHPSLFPADTCHLSEQQVLSQSVWQAEISAARSVEHVLSLDMTGLFCRSGQCPPMSDGMVVYRDGNHLTATFSASLAPSLASELSSIHKTYPFAAQTAVADQVSVSTRGLSQ